MTLAQMHGDITYNGSGLHEFVPQRTASYVSQVDDHIGEMTVRETFDFSVRLAAVYECAAKLNAYLGMRSLHALLLSKPCKLCLPGLMDLHAYVYVALCRHAARALQTKQVGMHLLQDVAIDMMSQ